MILAEDLTLIIFVKDYLQHDDKLGDRPKGSKMGVKMGAKIT